MFVSGNDRRKTALLLAIFYGLWMWMIFAYMAQYQHKQHQQAKEVKRCQQ